MVVGTAVVPEKLPKRTMETAEADYILGEENPLTKAWVSCKRLFLGWQGSEQADRSLWQPVFIAQGYNN